MADLKEVMSSENVVQRMERILTRGVSIEDVMETYDLWAETYDRVSGKLCGNYVQIKKGKGAGFKS